MTGLIFKEHYGLYRSPRVWEGLKPKGVRVSRKRAGRLMRGQKLRAGRRRKHVKTSGSSRRLAADNILNRCFRAAYPA
ncbi:MAG: IS3 family transposase [Treponema sp.]|nr:IS3 family transposase [Treponema sp.]